MPKQKTSRELEDEMLQRNAEADQSRKRAKRVKQDSPLVPQDALIQDIPRALRKKRIRDQKKKS